MAIQKEKREEFKGAVTQREPSTPDSRSSRKTTNKKRSPSTTTSSSNMKKKQSDLDESEHSIQRPTMTDNYTLSIGVLSFLKSRNFKKTASKFESQLKRHHADWDLQKVDLEVEQAPDKCLDKTLAMEVLAYLKNHKYKRTANMFVEELHDLENQGSQAQEESECAESQPPPQGGGGAGGVRQLGKGRITRGMQERSDSLKQVAVKEPKRSVMRQRAGSLKQLSVTKPPAVKELKRSVSIYGGIKRNEGDAAHPPASSSDIAPIAPRRSVVF